MSSGRGVAARPATWLKGPGRFSASESCDHRQRAAAHRPSRGWTRVGGPEDRSRLPDAGGPERRRHAHHLLCRAPWRCQDDDAERGERAAHRPRPASGERPPLRSHGGGGCLYDRPRHRSGPPGEHADGALQRREPFGTGLQSRDGPPEAGRPRWPEPARERRQRRDGGGSNPGLRARGPSLRPAAADRGHGLHQQRGRGADDGDVRPRLGARPARAAGASERRHPADDRPARRPRPARGRVRDRDRRRGQKPRPRGLRFDAVRRRPRHGGRHVPRHHRRSLGLDRRPEHDRGVTVRGERPFRPVAQRLPEAHPRTDAELLAALESDDGSALGALYDRHAGLVYGVAVAVLQCPQEAEDLTQEVFVTLSGDHAYDPGRGQLAGFLVAMTRSRAIDRLRSRGRHLRLLKRWHTTAPALAVPATPPQQVSTKECAERVRAVLGLVAYAKAAEPPAHLRAAVLRAAAEARKARRARVRPAWSTFGLAAAALLAIVLGIDNYRVRQELRLERTVTAMLQEPNIVLSFALHGTGTGSGALGKVALDLDSGKGAVAIERLAALPAGQVYRLWALVGEKNVPCGDFGVNPEGRVVTQFPIPVDSYTAPIAKLFLTVEPTAAPPQPSGPTVMTSA